MSKTKTTVTITVNGDVYRLGIGNSAGDISPADTLAETAGLPLSQALAALTELELLGAARGYPGRRYGL